MDFARRDTAPEGMSPSSPPPPPLADAISLPFLSATSPLASAIRRHDWAATPLGGLPGWPQPLQTLLSIMLGSRQPMFVVWGLREHVLLYNDAYAPLLGARHPAALGRPFFDVWTELRESLLPLVERVFSGESVHMDDIRLTVERNGFAEETNFAFSYTPVPDAGGTIVGLFCVCNETTAQVRGQEALKAAEARQAFRVDLSDALRVERDPQTLMALAAGMLGRHLGAGCVGYGEIDPTGQWIQVDQNWTAPGGAGVVGRHRLNDFGRELTDELRAGRTVRIDHTASHPLLSAPPVRAAYEAIGTRSFVAAPLVKDGRLAVVMFVLHPVPRTWTRQEQALVEEVAERTWASLQQLRAEAALAASEARARSIFRHLRSGLLIGDVVRDAGGRGCDWRYVEVNPAWEELLGLRAEAAIGRTMTELFPSVDREWIRDFVAVAETGRPRMFTRRGTGNRWYEGHAFRIEHDRFGVSFIDITERRDAEAALKDVMANLEQLVEARTRERNRVWEHSRDLLVVVGADGVVRDVSPSWTTLLGYAPGEMIGRQVFDFVVPDDREGTSRALAEAAERRLDGYENRYLHKDGSTRLISWHTSLEGDVVYAYGRDITVPRRQAEALREAEAQLRQSQKMEAVGQLTGGVAHDFNNILQVVSGNLQLIARAVADNEKVQRRVVNAQGAVSRGAKLASQLLAFSRRQPLEPRVVHPGRLLAGMDDMLRRALGEGIDIETRVQAGLWNTFVDPAQIENALLNLAINSRDAMDGWGTLTIEACNAALDEACARAHPEVVPGEYVLLAVGDTGSGMTAEVLGRAFEPFFSTKPVDKGTGLGLSMVYGFARQSGGHVGIESRPGKGTTVRLYLPRADEKEDPVAAPHGESVVGGSETILVAEDDDAVRVTVVEMLGELGYRVLTASDAASAWAMVDAGARPDLLFTDVVMPGAMKSSELAGRVRERLPGAAVLYTSGYPQDQIVHGGRLDLGVELLPKPYTRESLARKVRQVLDQRTR